MGFLSKLFGGGPKVNIRELVQNGAKIIDVRSPGEFKGGHPKNAVNIPLQSIEQAEKKFKKDEVLVLCCASGMRSGQATSYLKRKGYTQVYNAGSWVNLK